MFRSISWQLQFSNGLLVLAALIGLGVFGYLLRKSEVFREVDESLQTRSRQINSMLVRHDVTGLRTVESSDSIPALPPLPGSQTSEPAEGHYYQVWKAQEGALQLVFQSATVPNLELQVPLPRELQEGRVIRTQVSQRVMLSRAVRSYVILVGSDISNQKARLSQFLTSLVLGEGLFFVAYLGAGYWLTKRALSPVGRISETARTIAEGNLDQRIPEEGGSSELTDLSQVLNESFDRLESSLLRERQFTSNASHELRTPITAILTAAQSKPKSIEDYRDKLSSCATNARAMGQLVDQLLEMARFDSGRAELQKEPIDLDLLIDESIQLVRAMAEQKSIRIETEFAPVQASLNPVGISQIVRNLLDNALSYTDEGGEIRIRLTESESHVEISVADNGTGIAESDVPKLFDRFYRADQSRSDHTSGHYGLGLAISRQIARAHGGELNVESELGKGSVFTLRFPRS